jgi:hypothetical protein
MKITPVLYVQKIEDSLPFWLDRLGFTKTVSVPEGDHLGFVVLVKDGAELMLQTWEGLRRDAPGLLPRGRGTGGALFVEVADFADVCQKLEGADVVLPERTTFYGMREIGIREPSGHVIVFASPQGT